MSAGINRKRKVSTRLEAKRKGTPNMGKRVSQDRGDGLARGGLDNSFHE
jgi:hypothetical protein